MTPNINPDAVVIWTSMSNPSDIWCRHQFGIQGINFFLTILSIILSYNTCSIPDSSGLQGSDITDALS